MWIMRAVLGIERQMVDTGAQRSPKEYHADGSEWLDGWAAECLGAENQRRQSGRPGAFSGLGGWWFRGADHSIRSVLGKIDCVRGWVVRVH